MSNLVANDWDDPEDENGVIAEGSIATVENHQHFEMTDAERDLADEYGLNLKADPSDLVQSAVQNVSRANHVMVEAGLLLSAAHFRFSAERKTKKDNANPEFKELLERCGMPFQRAYELMRVSRYIATLSPEQREETIGLSKKKLLEFAKTDLEVLDQMILEGEEFDFKEANYDTTRRRIKEVEAKLAQAHVQVQKAEAEAKNYQKQLIEATKSRSDISDIVPPHVSDIRLEVAALYKKAELSIDGIAHQVNEVKFLEGEWSVSAARSTFAALMSLSAQIKGVAAQLHKTYGAELDGDNTTVERLTQKELFKCATEYKVLTGEHEHEAALREYERSLDKPKGKGRPKAAPVKES